MKTTILRQALISGDGMKRMIPKTLTLLLSASLALAVVGCDRDDLEVGSNNQTNNQTNNQEPDPNHGSNNHENGVNNHEYDDDYWDAHGPDEDEELLDVGEMQGSWRAAYVDGDVPLAYFDIFHDEGESEADGDYLMGNARGDFIDGRSGSLNMVSISGDDLEIRWNPTDDDAEMYFLHLERQDSENYVGEFSAERYPNVHEVEMVLRQFDD